MYYDKISLNYFKRFFDKNFHKKKLNNWVKFLKINIAFI